MLQMFGGMIIGSIMTIMLLGGAPVAEEILANAQNLYLDQRPDTTITLSLLVILSLFLTLLAVWPTRSHMNYEKAIQQIRRHCSKREAQARQE
jgi:hypothetical protein